MANQGTSIDMTRDTGSYSFVKDPDVQEFALSDYYGTHGNHPMIMNTYPEHADINDSRWGSIISGEWWLTDYGPEFADSDIGDQGHEAIAVNHLFDSEAALYEIDELLEKEPQNEDLLELKEDIKNNMSEEYGSSSVFFNVNIPDNIGIKTVDNPEIWYELKKDPRIPFMKYKGAIRVLGNSFEVYILNDEQLKTIKSFLAEQIDESDMEGEIFIEQINPQKSQSHRVIDFINFVDKPQDAWQESYTTPGQDVNDLSLTDIWEGAKDLGKSVLENVGIIDKPTAPVPPPQIPAVKTEPVAIQQPKIQTPSEKNISALQLYLQNPTPAAQTFLNGKKYTGAIDGKFNPQIKDLVSIVETNLNNLLETRKFSGILLTTTPDDIESALQKAQKYKLSLANLSRDERFFKLGKILIQKQGI